MTTCRRRLLRRSELRGRYIQFGKFSAQNERIIQAPISSLENGLKVQRKELDASARGLDAGAQERRKRRASARR